MAEPNQRDRSHLQRVPPHDLEVEARLLGTAMLHPEAAPTIASVDPADYYKPGHGHIADAIRSLLGEGSVVQAGTVAAELRQRGLLDSVGGSSFVIDLLGMAASTPAVPKLIDLVTSYARRRRMLGLLSESVDVVYRNQNPEGLVAELSRAVVADSMATVSTWDPVNLAAVLAGEGEVPEPVALARTDGVLLLYPGKIHALNAEPEAGKSWVALLACLQEMLAGRHVVYVDFEDDAAAVVGGPLELGAQPSEVIELFHYVRPDEAVGAGAALLRLTALCEAIRPSMAVVDGVTEALALNGWSSKDDTDLAAFFAAIPRPLARSGAAVLVLDHVVKDKETRGRWAIGSQHKMAGVDGAVYGLDSVKPFSRGNSGMGRLWVNKDRHGKVRPHAAGQRLISEIHFLSSDEGRAVNIELRPPSVEADGGFRPTGYMERVSRELESLSAGQGMSLREIRAVIHGKASVVDAAIGALVKEGYVTIAAGPRGARLHRSAKPYRDEQAAPLIDRDEGEDDAYEDF
jgi:hypothetical protein